MDVSLRQVTKDNYEAVCDLDVTPAQEDYVACNMWSLVESAYNDGFETRVIYLAEEPVGFFMWVFESVEKVSIWRFMVDHRHQQRGIGREALALVLNDIRLNPSVAEIEICYDPQNPVAKDFYATFGFVEMGMDNDNEDMIAIIKCAKYDATYKSERMH